MVSQSSVTGNRFGAAVITSNYLCITVLSIFSVILAGGHTRGCQLFPCTGQGKSHILALSSQHAKSEVLRPRFCQCATFRCPGRGRGQAWRELRDRAIGVVGWPCSNVRGARAEEISTHFKIIAIVFQSCILIFLFTSEMSQQLGPSLYLVTRSFPECE